MKLYRLLIIYLAFLPNLFSPSRVVTLSRDDCHLAHIKCSGTTKASGPNSVIYLAAQDGWGLENAGDEYTFKSEIVVDYGFGRSDLYDKGRGKILNVTDKTAVMQVTCIDGYGLKEETLIIEVKPRTFSRIMFKDKDETTQGVVNKIKCELIKLY